MYFDSRNLSIDLWDSSEGLPIAGAMIMILVDTIFYGLLAAWLDNILPTEYGTRRSPFFCLQPSYWSPKNVYIRFEFLKISNGTSGAQSFFIFSEENSLMTRTNSPQNDFEGPDIEEIPVGMRNTEALVISNIKKTFKSVGKEPVHAVKGNFSNG